MGCMDHAMDTFEAYIEQHQADDLGAGDWSRGYVRGTFISAGTVKQKSASASALL